ncbi:hypothetical protein KKG46_00640 [Patescibacteria group bacterium]|nr:hypothetical protein [Patescibacteria group bacterium]
MLKTLINFWFSPHQKPVLLQKQGDDIKEADMARILREDNSAILIPAWGFETQELAKSHVQKIKDKRGNDAFDLLQSEQTGKCYLPRIDCNDLRWDYSSHIVADPRITPPTYWHTLRRMERPKPQGGYNVLLAITGQRQYYHTHRQSTRHSGLWQRLSEGKKDCFAAWVRSDNQPLGGCLSEDDDSLRICTTRSARGVIFSREAKFDNDGNLTSHDWIAIFILAGILDKNPMKDDMLRIQTIRRHIYGTPDYEPSREDLLHDLDPEWIPALDSAIAGFRASCKPISLRLDRWRRMYQNQIKALQEDGRKPYGQSFKETIRTIDWQEALNLVEQPWQLEVVIEQKCNSDFSDAKGFYDPNYILVRNMLKRYQCSDERRNVLQQMVDEFVQIRDHLWNYSGD